MTTPFGILLDKHVNRVFERVLRERKPDIQQAKDRFGEGRSDRELLSRCTENNVLIMSNNGEDFEKLDDVEEHTGMLLYSGENLPLTDPEGLAQAIGRVLELYGSDELANSTVYLDEWHEWLHNEDVFEEWWRWAKPSSDQPRLITGYLHVLSGVKVP